MCFSNLHYEAGKALPCLRRWHRKTFITCAAVLFWLDSQGWGVRIFLQSTGWLEAVARPPSFPAALRQVHTEGAAVEPRASNQIGRAHV